MIKKVMLAALSMFLLGVLAACGTSGDSSEESNGTIVMGTSADFPPFESFTPEGEYEGFDIDLAHKVAEELNYDLEIEDMSFDGLIGSLQAERVDMVMAGMSATDDRKENVDFSVEYHHSGEMFVTQKDSEVTSLEDLEGQTLGVQLGTIQEEGAKELQDEYGFEIKEMDEATTLIQELKTGRVDVGYMDKTVAEGYIEEQDLAGFDDPTTSSPGMAIAFPKGSDLVEDVNEVLEQLIEDGTVEELEEKWELTEE
ncbi:transporter substrate-binding domain-containing protein [Aquisalibacillus elongatus]|uniref:Polar amino acid transport system substrate-binding protein n=1 Tax=Aquisalibacillus elongatus TaxID=485577 RepID=A0A3N5B7C9_9BACI|nr:transporter substrate-binding domain-containing protein [Aquisalibacillus elongatus]RPF53207.1 polar amino acid transport system substrate-binding protein [Aquisalibacillus elongatus]